MKVATYNVNSIRKRKTIVLEWLEKEKPDVLCLQETKVQDQDFPRSDFESAGYHCTFRGQKTFNGVAILTKESPTIVRYGFADGDALVEPRMITLEISGVTVINNYIPQGQTPDSDKFQFKLSWFRRLRDYLEKYYDPQQPVIWMGDFNVAPTAIDLYDPEGLWGSVCYCAEVHEALDHVKKWGLVDVFRKHDPEPFRYTFYDYRLPKAIERKLGWRIDHIWASSKLAECSRRCWIDMEPRLKKETSDHTVLAAEFRL